MKESTKQQRLDQAAAEILGISVEEVQQKRRGHLNDGRTREAEAIGLFLERPDAFFRRKCKNCSQEFLTSYKFVSNCSTECRIESLEKVGIYWNPMHTDDMWKRAQVPTEYSIPPKALKLLLDLAKYQDHSNQSSSELTDQSSSDIAAESVLTSYSTDPPTYELQKSPEPLPPESIISESRVADELADLGILW